MLVDEIYIFFKKMNSIYSTLLYSPTFKNHIEFWWLGNIISIYNIIPMENCVPNYD